MLGEVRSLLCAVLTLASAVLAQQEGKVRPKGALFEGELERSIVAYEDLQYTTARVDDARASFAERMSPATWRWLSRRPNRRRLGWVQADFVHGDVIHRLDHLYRAKPLLVAAFPDLAFAFACVWSGGTPETPTLPKWSRPVAGCPSMIASFEWYATRAKGLSFPIDKAPWLMLLHLVAESSALDDRDRRLHREDASPERRPRLPVAVLRAHGLPAVAIGEGGGACWLEFNHGAYRFVSSAVGSSHRQDPTESSLRLLVRGVNHSIDGLRKATIAAAVFRESRHALPVAFLAEALDLNPYADRVWKQFGRSYDLASAPLRERAEVAAVRTLAESLRDDPHCAHLVLCTALRTRPALAPSVRAAFIHSCKRVADNCAALGLHKRSGELLGYRARLAEAVRSEQVHGFYSEMLTTLATRPYEELFETALDGRLRTLRRSGPSAQLAELEHWLGQTRVSFEPGANERAVVRRMVAASLALGKPIDAARRQLSLLRRGRAPAAEFESALRHTPLIGTEMGVASTDMAPERAFLAGLRYTVASGSVGPIVASLQPIYVRGGERIFGDVYGQARGEVREVVARDGYVVSGLCARSSAVLDGFCLVFSKRRRKGISSKEALMSQWIGETPFGPEHLIGSRGFPIVGVRIRSGNGVVYAVGLVETRR